MPSIEASSACENPVVRVAVGVVKNSDGEILIARRQSGQHLAGFWEFPGGKVERGESLEQALDRELREEVAISILDSRFLMTIQHSYPDKTIQLEVVLVDRFKGSARGLEGQEIQWVAIPSLAQYTFPKANKQIVKYLLNCE